MLPVDIEGLARKRLFQNALDSLSDSGPNRSMRRFDGTLSESSDPVFRR